MKFYLVPICILINLYQFLLFSIVTTSVSAIDLTLDENLTGSDVVLAVTRKIYRSGIFEDDFFLGHRVALVSSQFGETLPLNSTRRGIWQLSREQLQETKDNSGLAVLRQRIEEHWSQEIGSWNLVTYEDLDIPLHSGLAFRLFIETLTELSVERPFLPSLLIDQAQFYTDHVNPDVNSTHFITSVSDFESFESSQKLMKCSSDADFVFVQDASCSVYLQNFTHAQIYFSNILEFFNFDQIRVGHVVYSDDTLINFGLDNNFTTHAELTDGLLNATRPDPKYTHTGDAISIGFKLFSIQSPAMSQRRAGGVPQILVSYTDGFSIDLLDDISNKTLNAGIETIAIGTAFSWLNWQLDQVAHNKPGRVLKHGQTYSLTPEFLYRSNQEFCSIPTNPPLDYETTAIVTAGEKRFFRYTIYPTNNNTITYLNVTVASMQGNMTGFYSIGLEETPDRVINDGEILIDATTLINVIHDEKPTNLYIGFIGIAQITEFTTLVVEIF